MAYAWKRQMCARYPEFFLCSALKYLFPCGDSLFLVTIEVDGNLRVGELHCVAMDDIAPNQQLLAFGGKHVAFMAGRMTRQCKRSHAFSQCLPGCKLLPLPPRFIRPPDVLKP